MEREKESSELSRVELFVHSCRFSDRSLKSTTHGGNESKCVTKDFGKVPTNSYGLEDIGRQKNGLLRSLHWS